jgi:hypothetical protein
MKISETVLMVYFKTLSLARICKRRIAGLLVVSNELESISKKAAMV